MKTNHIPTGFFTTKGYRALRRKVGEDMQALPDMETYYCAGMEIGCSNEEREDFECDNAADFTSDALPAEMFAKFANAMCESCGLKAENFGASNGPDVQS